jgi:uncharacterized membrane protein
VSHAEDDAPVLRAAAAVYVLGSFICHQRPERSFRIRGIQVPVCARCEGLYLGAPFGIAALMAARGRYRRAISSRGMWRRVVIAASIVSILTLAWEWATGSVTPNIVRAIAGALLGAAVAATVTAVVAGDLR